MTDVTDQDKGVVRDAALGAMALVSRADPGFFAMFKESVAGSKAVAAAPSGLRERTAHCGGMPMPPQVATVLRLGSPGDFPERPWRVALAWRRELLVVCRTVRPAAHRLVGVWRARASRAGHRLR